MDNFIGQIFKQNCGDSLRVLKKSEQKYNNIALFECQFLIYPNKILATKDHILKGKVVNYLVPSVSNVGYIGIGKYNKSNNLKYYQIWYDLLSRCYNKNSHNYKNYGAKGIIVCDEWKCFQNFAAWYEENYIKGYELDKDILVNISHSESKIYSPNTCLFIPAGLNSYLAGDNKKTGVYLTKSKKYQAKVRKNNKSYVLGTYSTFEEAKQIYAKEKYKCWLKEIEKYTLSQELKDILLKYDFSWSWLLILNKNINYE